MLTPQCCSCPEHCDVATLSPSLMSLDMEAAGTNLGFPASKEHIPGGVHILGARTPSILIVTCFHAEELTSIKKSQSQHIISMIL